MTVYRLVRRNPWPKVEGRAGRDKFVLSPSPEATVKFLKRASELGRMSKELRDALTSIVSAIEKKDWEIASELSMVKSYIVSVMDATKDAHGHPHHFREDNDYNEKVLGDSLYDFLDHFNFQLAMMLDQMPAGMMVMGRGGVRSREARKYYGIDPTLLLIRQEHAAIVAGIVG